MFLPFSMNSCWVVASSAAGAYFFLVLLLLEDDVNCFIPRTSLRYRHLRDHLTMHLLPQVWIEEAEEGFVDNDENLEEGEVCLKSIKAFASNSRPGEEPRFLAAGALVQRTHSMVCDAWTADALEESPNLTIQGSQLILDELFLFHLQLQSNDPIQALRTFVLQCGSPDSESTCASFMAGQSRGFRKLSEQLNSDSIYVPYLYHNHFDGMVMDCCCGNEAYEQLSMADCSASAKQIPALFPDEEMIQRFTTKRYRSGER